MKVEQNTPMARNPKYDLEERLLDYAAAIIRFTDKLPASRAGIHIANQLLRSGTSPLSNHGEAQAAESPDDFIHKLKVCLKELRESLRWIKLVERSGIRSRADTLGLGQETDQLIRIFVASLKTATGRAIRRQLPTVR